MAGRTDDTPKPDEVERELDGSRERLADLLDELDRRRHEMMDMPAQVRRHIVPLAIAGGVVVAGVAVAIAVAVGRNHERHRLTTKAHRLRLAVERMAQHPDRVAKDHPNMLKKVLTAAATTAVSILAKRLVQATMQRVAFAHKQRQLTVASGAAYPALMPRY